MVSILFLVWGMIFIFLHHVIIKLRKWIYTERLLQVSVGLDSWESEAKTRPAPPLLPFWEEEEEGESGAI